MNSVIRLDRSLVIFLICLFSLSSHGLGINNLSIGYLQYEYDEPSVMTVKGPFLELAYSYRNKLIYNFLYRAELEVAYGAATYSGALVNFNTNISTPVSADSKDIVGDARLFFDTPFKKGNLTAVLGLGVAARYLLNNIQSSGAYLREQTYIYAPISFAVETIIKNKYRAYAGAEYDYLLRGLNTSEISGPVNFVQNSGYGYRGFVGFAFDWKVPLNVELMYRYWSIEDSSSASVIVANQTLFFREPFNTTQILNLRLGMSF